MIKGPLTSIVVFGSFLAGAALAAQWTESPSAQSIEDDRQALIENTVDNHKRGDAALEVYERIERVEKRKSANDAQPAEVQVFRVVPAGTGADRIPLGPDAKPVDAAAYCRDLEKLVRSLEWAAKDGHAQRDAYQKFAKRQRERNELIDATRKAFLYTRVGEEPRGDRILAKYRLDPNPAYRPTSRMTAIFSKVHGYAWIDEEKAELARFEAEITDDVPIGGFLAKVYKGSHFMLERYEMVPGIWLPSFSQYDFDGRKLFSSFGVHERTFYSQYRRVGPPKEALAIIHAELDKFSNTAADP